MVQLFGERFTSIESQRTIQLVDCDLRSTLYVGSIKSILIGDMNISWAPQGTIALQNATILAILIKHLSNREFDLHRHETKPVELFNSQY